MLSPEQRKEHAAVDASTVICTALPFVVAVGQLLSHIGLCDPMDCCIPGSSLLQLSSRDCPNACPLNQWCYLTISSSASLFSFGLPSFPASGSFPMSWLFPLGGQSIGASASILPMNIRGHYPTVIILPPKSWPWKMQVRTKNVLTSKYPLSPVGEK